MLVNKRFLSDFFELYVASMMKETRKNSVKLPTVFSMYGQIELYTLLHIADIFSNSTILDFNASFSSLNL